MYRASKFAQDLPQPITTDGVESLCKVAGGNKKVTVLFPAFLPKKSCNENHVSGPRATKATLRYRNHTLYYKHLGKFLYYKHLGKFQ